MVAAYSLFRKNLKDNTYVTEPNYAMRTSVMARQYLATFVHESCHPSTRISSLKPSRYWLEKSK
jgi:flagellum-specific peptidoglycan hydrolase FlgJ